MRGVLGLMQAFAWPKREDMLARWIAPFEIDLRDRHTASCVNTLQFLFAEEAWWV